MRGHQFQTIRGHRLWLQIGVSAVALAASGVAYARQATTIDDTAIEEIVVTATRKSESVQDVPMNVTPVSGEQLNKLKMQRFEDVQQLSPGLSLEKTGRSAETSLRGVSYNPDTGAAPSIDTYFNEIPIDPQFMFQSIFDVQQIEVLRGPQGMQRGRPAPTGAITLTTRRPNMNDYGATFIATHSEFHANNVQIAGSIPIIQDVLAVRLAALYDESDNGGVKNIKTGDESHRITRGLRATAEWKPVEPLTVVGTYNRLRAKGVNYVAFEGPGKGYNGPVIADGRDLVSPTEGSAQFPVKVDLVSLNAAYDFGKARLSYNFGWVDALNSTNADLDAANAIPNYVAPQIVRGPDKTVTHELRLESVGGRFVDYTVGLWRYSRDAHVELTQAGSAFLPGAFGPTNAVPVGPPNPLYVLNIALDIPAKTTNQAIYGNLNFHLPAETELSVGGRYFKDKSRQTVEQSLSQTLLALPSPLPPGAPCSFLPASAGFTGGSHYAGTCDLVAIPATTTMQNGDRSSSDGIWGATLRHKFGARMMAYGSFGTSWRGGGLTVGLTGVPDDILFFKPEKSKSFELGAKTEWLDGRLRVNASVFKQNYDGFINTSGSRIPYLQTAGSTKSLQATGNLTFNADAVATGAELEVLARPTRDLTLTFNWSTADGHYKNALIPCRDTNNDGVDDNGPLSLSYTPPNGQVYATCRSSGRINNQPNWSLNSTVEFTRPLGGTTMDGYVRALVNYRDKVAFNSYTVKSYGTVNLFGGVRTQAWDLGVFARNLLNERLQLSDPNEPLGSFSGFDTGYRPVNYMRGRELGVSLRYSFGAG